MRSREEVERQGDARRTRGGENSVSSRRSRGIESTRGQLKG